MRRQNEKHNLCVRLCFFDAKYEKKWDYTHARIAGSIIVSPTKLRMLAIHTHARIAGRGDKSHDKDRSWQSTPTRELRE